MNSANDCRAFRARLEERLVGRPLVGGLGELSWHRHLFGCEACRALLEREEALEMLLASLPEPRLPRDLVERVLARLRSASELDLDGLLDLDQTPSAPADLATRVLAGLERERSGRYVAASLDELLEVGALVEVPGDLAARTLAVLAPLRRREVELVRLEALLERAGAVEIPADLGERVLAGLEQHRGRPVRRVAFGRRAWVATAAGVLVAAGLWTLWPEKNEPMRVDDQVARVDEPDAEMLEYFDLLAEDLLWEDGANLDVVASISLAGRDELLLEFGAFVPDNDPAAAPDGAKTEEDEG